MKPSFAFSLLGWAEEESFKTFEPNEFLTGALRPRVGRRGYQFGHGTVARISSPRFEYHVAFQEDCPLAKLTI